MAMLASAKRKITRTRVYVLDPADVQSTIEEDNVPVVTRPCRLYGFNDDLSCFDASSRGILGQGAVRGVLKSIAKNE